jgi:hypothetical protein
VRQHPGFVLSATTTRPDLVGLLCKGAIRIEPTSKPTLEWAGS